MKALIIDRDEVSSGMLHNFLTDNACHVDIEQDRNRVFDKKLSDYDLIFLDLSTLTSPIKYMVDLKSRLDKVPYLIFLSKDEKENDALKSGANAFLPKPVNRDALTNILTQAKCFSELTKSLSDPSKEYPFHKGIISNAAMHELFQVSLERTTRYIETACLVVFRLKHIEALYDQYGPDLTDLAGQWMANFVIRMRRQADLMAQTGPFEFMILMQRPSSEDEPLEAAHRFVAGFLQRPDHELPDHNGVKMNISVNVQVIKLPSARVIFDESIQYPRHK